MSTRRSTSQPTAEGASPQESTRPENAGAVLAALILVAAVANLNLAVANVALPDIGKAFDAGQTSLNLVAVGYSLGLAASVLYLGALGDRHGDELFEFGFQSAASASRNSARRADADCPDGGAVFDRVGGRVRSRAHRSSCWSVVPRRSWSRSASGR